MARPPPAIRSKWQITEQLGIVGGDWKWYSRKDLSQEEPLRKESTGSQQNSFQTGLREPVLAYLAWSSKTSGTLVLVRPRTCTIDADRARP